MTLLKRLYRAFFLLLIAFPYAKSDRIKIGECKSILRVARDLNLVRRHKSVSLFNFSMSHSKVACLTASLRRLNLFSNMPQKSWTINVTRRTMDSYMHWLNASISAVNSTRHLNYANWWAKVSWVYCMALSRMTQPFMFGIFVMQRKCHYSKPDLILTLSNRSLICIHIRPLWLDYIQTWSMHGVGIVSQLSMKTLDGKQENFRNIY